VLAGGEELTARAVVAGIDPKRRLTGLADPVADRPEPALAADNIRTPGTVAKVNLVLSGLPRFTARRRRRGCSAAASSIAPGIDAMERAHDAAKYGRSRRADDGGDDPVARRSRRWSRARRRART
jgi:phytoene dehydrogenase-like protein